MDEHVIIVGATSPLAAETGAAFQARGSRVSLISRSGAVPAEASGAPTLTAAYSFDLGDLADIPALFRRISDERGAASRICFFQRYRSGAENPWDGEYAVSLRATSVFIETFHAQPPTAADRSVVIVSSPADTGVVLEQSAAYHAAKAGLSQMVRYYAVTLGERGIRVNGVKPALVLKDRAKQFYADNPDLVTLFDRVIPLRRMGRPADIANAVAFLSSDLAAYITGQVLSVDGGLSLHEAGSLARLSASVFNEGLADPRWQSNSK